MLNLRKALICLLTYAVLSLSGCSDGKRLKAAQRMEGAVASTPTPFDVQRYSQYYFERVDGSIAASFVIHIPDSETARTHVKNACTRDMKLDYPCNQDDYGIVDPGQRKWLEREIDLPGILGGGCTVITLAYNPKTDTVSVPQCNGPL